MDKRQRILIAGGGPVGLAAGVELARRGFHPRILDPDAAVSPESRALAVNPRTLDLMEPSGVTEMMLQEGLRARRAVIRRGTRVLAAIDLTGIPHRFNFLLVLAQSETERILERRLAEIGVTLERSLALARFDVNGTIDAVLSDGSHAACDRLLGCDGAHSLVRKSLDIPYPGETQPEEFGLADVELASWPFTFDTVVLTMLDTHLVPFIPMREGMGRFISTRGDCLNSLPPDAKVKSVLWETDFKISYRQAQTYQKGHVFLAGDAAHIHSPVGGRGMNLGIEDACWLAWLIEQGREAEYTALRHPVGRDVLKFTHRFTAFARQRGKMQNLALGHLMPLVAAFPPLRKFAFNALTALNTPAAPWLAA